MKATKGPWAVRHAPNGNGFFVEGNEVAGQVLGRDYRREILSDEDYPSKLADATLISAAPELLEALERSHRFLRKNGYDMSEIDAALNKAKGE